MGTTTFSLVAATICVVLVMTFLLGQRRRLKSEPARETTPAEPVRIDPATIVQHMTAAKRPENPGCLAALESLWGARLRTYAEHCPGLILAPISGPYAALVAFLQTQNEQVDMDHFRQGIEWAEVTDMRNTVETTMADLPTPMVEEFNEEVRTYAEMYSDTTLERFLLNPDHLLAESARWMAVGRNEVVPLLSDLSDLQMLLQRCADLLPAVQNAVDSTGFALSALARHGGAGPLAATLLVIGVPAPRASVASEFHNGKSHHETIEDFNNAWGHYLEEWDRVAERCRAANAALQPKLETRLHLFFQRHHETLYARLDERGHSLQPALAYQQTKQTEWKAARKEGGE
jgi:hypothetical protein